MIRIPFNRLRWLALLAVYAIAVAGATGNPVVVLAGGGIEFQPLTGKIVQMTPGGTIPPDLEVNLVVISPEETVESASTATVNESGVFEFPAPPVDKDFEISVTFQGVSTAQRFAPGDDLSSVELEIFEITDSIDSLSVLSYGTIIDTSDDQENALVVMDRIQLSNNGDRIIVFNEPASLTVPVPEFDIAEGYTDLFVESDIVGVTVEQFDDHVEIRGPFPPGISQFFVRYTLPVSDSELRMGRKLPLGADQVQVLVREAAFSISIPGMAAATSTTIGESSYSVWNHLNYPPGSAVEFTISGLPQTAFYQSLLKTNTGKLFFVAGVIGLAVLVLVAIFVYRKFAPVRGEAADDPQSTRQDLLAMIAAIDDSHSVGAVSGDEYQRVRRELINRVKKLPTRRLDIESKGIAG